MYIIVIYMEFDKLLGFDWDKGNVLKNWEKHKVKHTEAEEIFANKPTVVLKDESHSFSETRFQILGTTNRRRRLSVIFTIRNQKIRIISARDMNGKEKIQYEQKT